MTEYDCIFSVFFYFFLSSLVFPVPDIITLFSFSVLIVLHDSSFGRVLGSSFSLHVYLKISNTCLFAGAVVEWSSYTRFIIIIIMRPRV